uniref:DnaJ (Hsp40) homolog, subfamily C, member 24 n=1 Tax=Oncorhynchus tshawytscha TaxID=74940 RepID=A0AAZ3QC97_ONCTS
MNINTPSITHILPTGCLFLAMCANQDYINPLRSSFGMSSGSVFKISLYHPDKQGPDVTVTEAEEHLHRFIEVDQAWKVLSNQETKRAYDLQLRASELNQSWPVDAHVCLDDMTWDDDNEVYTYGCRCGGEFSIGREEAEGEEAIVCCDTCSLSIEVKTTT